VDLCALLQFNYQVYDTAGTVNVGGYPFQVMANSLLGTLKVTGWQYATGSTGLRFWLLLSVRSTNSMEYLVTPGNLMDPPPFPGVQSVTVLDALGRKATLGFISVVVLSGTVAYNATLTGPYQQPSDVEGRFFSLDVPSPSNNMEIFFNLYVPNLNDVLSAGNSKGVMLWIVYCALYLLS